MSNWTSREMLSRWLKWAPSNHPWPTLEGLALALNKAGKESLAYDLKEQYLTQNGECCVHVFKYVSSGSSPGIQNLLVHHCKTFVLWNAAQFSMKACLVFSTSTVGCVSHPFYLQVMLMLLLLLLPQCILQTCVNMLHLFKQVLEMD